MRSRYIPGSMVRATEENWANFSWNKLVAEYPEVTDPTNLAQLLQEKGESMQEKLPDEYSSDVHLRNWLMKCISQTPFKRFMPTSRLTSSTEVAIAIARSVELHREEFAYRSPIHSTVGRYPRRFVPERTPSTHYESQDTKEDKSEETELDFPKTTNPHDQLQIYQISLKDPKYTTRVKATDNTRVLMSFRGKNDTRDPPMRPDEKPNDISKRSVFRSAVLDAIPNITTSSVVQMHLPPIRYTTRRFWKLVPNMTLLSKREFLVHTLLRLQPLIYEVSSNDMFLAKGNTFLGCCVDARCLYEVIGKKQHDAFCEEEGLGGHPLKSSCRMFRFGGTTVQSLGVEVVYFYASDGMRISYESDVINLDVPAQIGLSLWFASETDILLKEKKLASPNWSVELVFKQGHLFIEPRSSHQVMYSKHALATFHKKLGHSNADSTERFPSIFHACHMQTPKPHPLYPKTQELDSCLSLVLKPKFNTRDVGTWKLPNVLSLRIVTSCLQKICVLYTVMSVTSITIDLASLDHSYSCIAKEVLRLYWMEAR
jgi:hypothetical protein